MPEEKHQMVTQISEVEGLKSKAGKKYLKITTIDEDEFLVFDNKYMPMSQDQIHALILENKDKHFKIDYSFGEQRGDNDPPMFLNGIGVVDPDGEEFEGMATKLEEPPELKETPDYGEQGPVVSEVKVTKTKPTPKPAKVTAEPDWDNIQLQKFRSYAAGDISSLMAAEVQTGARERYDLNALKIQADEIVRYVLEGE